LHHAITVQRRSFATALVAVVIAPVLLRQRSKWDVGAGCDDVWCRNHIDGDF
jgi:hypothetical protein